MKVTMTIYRDSSLVFLLGESVCWVCGLLSLDGELFLDDFCLLSLRLTFSHLKMDGWKISMLLGAGLFSGANLLLVSGSVYTCLSCMDARRMDFSGSWVDSQDRDSSVSVVAYFFCIRLIPIRIWNSDIKHENIQYAWLFLITITIFSIIVYAFQKYMFYSIPCPVV